MKSFLQAAAIIVLALVASCAVLCIAALAASPFAPERGLVLLKNGQVIEGGILREGDRYVVTLGERGERGELKIPVTDVDVTCQSLQEAYEHKCRQIVHRAVKPHLDLADWCLRNGLVDRAADELVSAMAIDPSDARIAVTERRMKLAVSSESTRPRPRITQSLPPTQEEIEATLRTLPPEAVEAFTSNIQPLLLSRCAITACHGPGSTASYHLVRPPLKHANKTRETQRNLFATLAQISADGESPLLTKPLVAHGGVETPVLEDRDRRQIEQLAAWIDRVKGPSKHGKRIPSDGNVRPAAFEEEVPTDNAPSIRRLPSISEPRAFEPATSAKPLSQEAITTKATVAKKPAPGRDPFDPELFNQRFRRE